MKVKSTVPPVTATTATKKNPQGQGESKKEQNENTGFWNQFFDRFALKEEDCYEDTEDEKWKDPPPYYFWM